MRWPDLDGKIWIILAARMNGRSEHRVPLVERALSILEEMKSLGVHDLTFPGEGPDRPLAEMTLSAVLKRMEHAKAAYRRGDLMEDWAS